jgi:hypothetical protein
MAGRDHAGAKDVAGLEAAEKADLLARLDRNIGAADLKAPGAAKVLVGIDAGLQAEVEARAIDGSGSGWDRVFAGCHARFARERTAGENGRGNDG